MRLYKLIGKSIVQTNNSLDLVALDLIKTNGYCFDDDEHIIFDLDYDDNVTLNSEYIKRVRAKVKADIRDKKINTILQ
jgi:hypothetical protein